MPAAEPREQKEKESLFQIFDEVQAILSEELIQAIPDSIVTFFTNHGVPGKLQETVQTASKQYCLLGTFTEVISAHQILHSYFERNNESTSLSENGGLENVWLGVVAESDNQNLSANAHVQEPQEEANKSNESPIIEQHNEEVPSEYLKKRVSQRIQERLLKDKQEELLKEQGLVHEDSINLPDPMVIEIHCSKFEGEPVGEQEAVVEELSSLNNEDSCSDKESTLEAEGNASKLKKKNYELVTPFKYFCHLCSFKTKRNSHYLKHMTIHEKVKTLYQCSKCSFTTMRLGHLRRHEMTHNGNLHQCMHCGYRTDDDKLLIRHIRIKHSRCKKMRVNSKMLECPHCNYKTARPLYYERHMRSHESQNGQKKSVHQCEQCCYKTKRKEHFVRHMNNVHGDKRPYLCHLCGKAFKRGDALRQHHLTHDPNASTDGNTYRCPMCDKVFRTHCHLVEHQAIHSNVRSFLCEICGAAFKTRSVQRKHVQTIHRNPRAFSCTGCNKKFNTHYALKRHQKVHSAKSSGMTNKQLVLTSFTDTAEKEGTSSTLPMVALKDDLPVPNDTEFQVATITSLDGAIPTTIPIQETCEVIGTLPSTLLQPTETTTLFYLANTLSSF